MRLSSYHRLQWLSISIAGLTLTIGPTIAAEAPGGDLVLGSRVERVEVLRGLTIVLPLRLVNTSETTLRIVEPSPGLNSLELALDDADGQAVPRIPIEYSPVLLNTQPQVVVLAPGESFEVDLWLGDFGRTTLLVGEYSATVTYRCTAHFPEWNVSPQVCDRPVRSEPIPILVTEPTDPEDRAAADMLKEAPKGPAPLDEFRDQYEVYIRSVVERYPESAYALAACFRGARFMYYEGETARALAWIERARGLDPEYDPAEKMTWMQIGCLLPGRPAEAEVLLRRAKSRRAHADWLLGRIAGQPAG